MRETGLVRIGGTRFELVRHLRVETQVRHQRLPSASSTCVSRGHTTPGFIPENRGTPHKVSGVLIETKRQRYEVSSMSKVIEVL